jgi:hypothetical protein
LTQNLFPNNEKKLSMFYFSIDNRSSMLIGAGFSGRDTVERGKPEHIATVTIIKAVHLLWKMWICSTR